jgi:SPW repeat-containing protein
MTTQYGNYTPQSRATRWQDWATLILAVWLFISPWLLQFGAAVQVPPAGAAPGATVAVSHAAWNAWVLGVIVFLVALSAIGSIEVWQEYWNLVLGAWIFAAPWALGFVGLRRASWDHWIVCGLIFLLAVWGVSQARNVPATAAPRALDDRPPRRPVT